MADLTLAEVKVYCKLTDSDEDTLLQALMDVAEEYLSEAGVDSALADTARYKLAVEALTLHWYDNRGNTAEGLSNQAEIPRGLGSLIKQLQNYVPPPEDLTATTE